MALPNETTGRHWYCTNLSFSFGNKIKAETGCPRKMFLLWPYYNFQYNVVWKRYGFPIDFALSYRKSKYSHTYGIS